MIFAAGLGTRLGALTRELPKALVPVAGTPMLERVASRLIAAGCDRLIINTHHFAEKIRDFVEERGGFGVEVVFSYEPNGPLETGGGLSAAATLFRSGEPFFLHNADVLTDMSLESLYAAHTATRPLATLAVMRRETSRFLLFDRRGLLGRADTGKSLRIEARPAAPPVDELAFGGVHVVSPEILPLLPSGGTFSILEPYLAAASKGYRIDPFRVDGSLWIDVGKPEQLEKASLALEHALQGGNPM